MIILDRAAATRLKGLAITAIVFHNFFHLIFSKTRENEINFATRRFKYFLTDFATTPAEWIQSVFAYFGHFGVQVFIFLAAYGLTISYPDAGLRSGFLLSRIKKLFPIIVMSILSWILLMGLVRAGIPGPLGMLEKHFKDIMLLLLGLYTVVPGNAYPMVGPWWFIPFIVQFYFCWALAGKFITGASRNALLVMIMAGVFINYTLTPFVESNLAVNLLLTPMGHLPEIFLGVYFARYGVSTSLLLMFSSLAGLVLSGIYHWMWPIHHLSALVVFLILAVRFRIGQGGWFGQRVHWLGRYSLPIFLVNGFLRGPFVTAANEAKMWGMDLAMGFSFFCFACLAAFLVERLANSVYPQPRE